MLILTSKNAPFFKKSLLLRIGKEWAREPGDILCFVFLLWNHFSILYSNTNKYI